MQLRVHYLGGGFYTYFPVLQPIFRNAMKLLSLYFLSMVSLNLIGSAFLLSGCSGPKKPAEAITISIDSTFTEPVDGTAVVAPDSLPTINTLSEAERKEGWQLLFDGKSTSAWRGYGKTTFPDSGWAVQEGLLVVKGDDPKVKGRDIVTQKEFGDFELTLEFKLAPEASSGIFYRVKEEKGVPIWQNAPEYQLIDHEAWEKKLGSEAMRTHRTGDNFGFIAWTENKSVQAMKLVGEWNEARVKIHHNQRPIRQG